MDNLKYNKINWKKAKIRSLLYKLHEEAFPKEDIFLMNINPNKIKFTDNPEIGKENFFITKADFINFIKNNRLEKYIMLSSPFKLNLYTEIDELFIDCTFKVASK